MSTISYSELYCLSNFSFLRAASHPEELVRRAAELGYKALAITDECSVAGVVRAYQVIREEKLSIQLIIGSEFRLQQQELVVIAPSRLAYAQLCQLITQARTRAPKGQYQIELEDFSNLDECLFIWLPHPANPSPLLAKTLLQHKSRLWLGCHRRLTTLD